jgi:peroxiredoxin
VIGQDGKIVHVYSELNPSEHVKETLAAVRALAKKS